MNVIAAGAWESHEGEYIQKNYTSQIKTGKWRPDPFHDIRKD